MTFVWQWPQIVYVSLVAASLLYGVTRHGRMDRYPHNAPLQLILTAIVMTLLYFGGFFTEVRP